MNKRSSNIEFKEWQPFVNRLVSPSDADFLDLAFLLGGSGIKVRDRAEALNIPMEGLTVQVRQGPKAAAAMAAARRAARAAILMARFKSGSIAPLDPTDYPTNNAAGGEAPEETGHPDHWREKVTSDVIILTGWLNPLREDAASCSWRPPPHPPPLPLTPPCRWSLALSGGAAARL